MRFAFNNLRTIIMSASLSFFFAFSGCVPEDKNTANQGSPNLSASQGFEDVRAIFNAQCLSCHPAFGQYTEAEWVSYRYVVPGDPSGSLLFQRLRGANVGGIENMPQTGGSLSSSEIAAIYNWIENLGNTSPANDKPNAAQRFEAALSILQTSCFSCHSIARTAVSSEYLGTTVAAFGTFTTENDFVVSGFVLPQFSESSWLIQALKGNSIGTMPKTGETLSPAALTILEKWVEGMGEP
jgi:hypothetical protein